MKSKFSLNPIMVKEFRSRMRGWRAFAILTSYLLFLAIFSYGIYRIALLSPPFGTPLSPMIGQWLYIAITNLSLFFVAFLMPALTATAISSESEKLTLEMLQATPLSTHTILVGKLVSSSGYIFLLLFATIPLLSIVFTFGGVAPSDLLIAGLIILSTAICIGMIGFFFSAWRKRTIQAMVLSYLTILILVGGTFSIYIFWGFMIEDLPPRYLLLVNPFSALASVLGRNSPDNSPLFFFRILAGLGMYMDNREALDSLRPLWQYTLTFYIGLSACLYFLATRFIKPIRPWYISRKSLAIIMALSILYIGLSTAIFFPDIKADWAFRQADLANNQVNPVGRPGMIEPAMIEKAPPLPPQAPLPTATPEEDSE